MKKFMALMLAVMTVLSTVSFAAPQMAETSVNVSEIYENEIENGAILPEEETADVQDEATLAAETNIGTLIAKVDFDNVETGATLATGTSSKTADGWITSNLPEGFPALHLNITGGTITVADDADGNGKHAEWDLAKSVWAKLGFYSHDNFMPSGVYTYKFDFKWESFQETAGTELTTYPNVSVVYTPNFDDGSFTNGESNLAADAQKVSGTTDTYQLTGYFVSDGLVLTQGSTAPHAFKGLGKIAAYFNHNGSYASAKATIDNIELYYRPTSTLTVEDSNKNTLGTMQIIDGKLPDQNGRSLLDTVTTTLTNTYGSQVAKDGYVLTGWNNKATGKAYTATTGDVTVVPAFSKISTKYGFDAKDFSSLDDYKTKVSGNRREYTNEQCGGYIDLEKPAKGTGSVTNTELIDLDDGSKAVRYTFDVPANTRTDANIYLDAQVNATNMLETSTVKGIYYTFRLLGPDGEPADSKYFTTNGKITSSTYFATDWWSDDAETSCYTGEAIDGWHWGECVHSTSKDAVSKGGEYNGEWLTVYIDLENHNYTDNHKGNNWDNAFVCKLLRHRLINELYTAGQGFILDVKSLNFVLADEDEGTQYVSHDFYDLRKGYFDLTVDGKFEIYNLQNLGKFIVSGADVAHVDEIENNNGTYTYRFYAKYDLNGKTVKMTLPNGSKTVEHTYTMQEVADKADGENLVPNGDFSNKYYIPLARNANNDNFTNGGAFDAEITDDGLVITLTKPSEWCTTTISNVKFKENTNYYIAVKGGFTGDSKDAEGNAHHSTGDVNETVTFYTALLDGKFDPDNTNDSMLFAKKVDYIPSTTSNLKLNLNSSTFEKTQSYARMISIKDVDFYTSDDCKYVSSPYLKDSNYNKELAASDIFNNPKISLQLCTSKGKDAGYYKNADGNYDGTLAAGLQYTVNSLVVKEMFPVTVKVGNKTVETLYAAKDIEMVLPAAPSDEDLGGAFFNGWSDGTNTYAAGAKYTLTKAGAFTLNAVTSFAPETQNEISVRTDTYTGIRFKAAVKQALKSNDNTTEIGFIIARKTALTAAGVSDINSFTFDTDVKKVSGKAYVKAESLNKVFASDDTLKLDYFTAVVYGIPESQYSDVLVARPYVLNGGTYYYGTAMEMSLKAAATAVKNAEGYVTDEVIESILSK